MSDLRTYIGLYVRGDAAAKTRELAGSFEQLASRGGRQLGMLSRSLSLASSGLDRLSNRYTALVTGAGAAGTLKMVSDLETRITYLGIQAEKTAPQIDALKAKVFEIANAPDIRVDPAQILDAFDAIIEKTGNFEVAEQNLRNIGLAIRATNAAGADIGAMIADLNEKFGLTGADEFLATLDGLTNQGKAGAFTLQNLATQGERVTAAYAALGRQGPVAVREMGAMLQMIKKGTGAPEQAATAFEALLRTLNDAEKAKKLSAAGIRLTDPNDPKRLRSIIDIVKEVIAKSGGDMTKISGIFDAEALRAFNAAVIEYKETGGFASLDAFFQVSGDGKTLMNDAARAAQTFGAALQSLRTEWETFADAHLTEPVRELAAAINELDPGTVQATLKALAWGGAALGGLVAVNQVAGGVRAAAGIWRSLRGRGGGADGLGAAASGLAGAVGGPVPVVVMNWPGGMASSWAPGAAGSSAARGRGRAGLASRAGRLMGRLGGRAFLPLALLGGGLDLAGSLMAGDGAGAAGAGGRMAGGLAGAAAGAALGSFVPVIGTAIGGIVGGLAGSLGGEALARGITGLFTGDDEAGPGGAPAKQPLHGRIEVQIRSDQPARLTRLESSPGLDLEADIGRIMASP